MYEGFDRPRARSSPRLGWGSGSSGGRLRALLWMASKASGLPRSNLHQPGVPAATPSLASAERGAWGNLSSLDGFGRRAGRAASTATATASAAPRVVLCVADGIVRIVVHVAAGEDLGGLLRRGIDRLIALQPVRRSAATTTETRNRTGASQLIGAGQWDVRLVDEQGKSAITRSVAGGGDLIEQRTLNFNSMRRQEWSRLSPLRG